METVTYYSGREISSFEPRSLKIKDGPQGGARLWLRIVDRYNYCHQLFSEINELYKIVIRMESFPLGDGSLLSPLAQYKFQSENLIFQIRRTIDSLIQLSSLTYEHSGNDQPIKLKTSDLGQLVGKNQTAHLVHPIINGDKEKYAQDGTNFLEIINDLFNAIKHHASHEEDFGIPRDRFPFITSYYAEKNNYCQPVVFHNHYLHQLMMGYQDNVSRIVANLKLALRE